MTTLPNKKDPLQELLHARDLLWYEREALEIITQLQLLGYSTHANALGGQTIHLTAYAARPLLTLFGSSDFDPAVGHIMQTYGGGCGTMRQRVNMYDLTAPVGLGHDIIGEYAPLNSLRDLEHAATAFNAAHDLDIPIAQTVQLHYAYSGDIEKVLEAANAGINGKLAADMLMLGYTHAEILQLRNAPVSMIFDGAPDRALLKTWT